MSTNNHFLAAPSINLSVSSPDIELCTAHSIVPCASVDEDRSNSIMLKPEKLSANGQKQSFRYRESNPSLLGS